MALAPWIESKVTKDTRGGFSAKKGHRSAQAKVYNSCLIDVKRERYITKEDKWLVRECRGRNSGRKNTRIKNR